MSKLSFDPESDDLNRFLARTMQNPSQRKAYMASRAWYLRKQALALRSNGRCERCGNGKYEVAHHLTYAHFGAEFLNELQALCRACHAFLHGRSDVDPTKTIHVQMTLSFEMDENDN